jgi:cell division protein FtsZ
MAQRKIVVVGIGGGGCRIVERIAPCLGDNPSIGAIDTDAGMLSELSVPTKLEVGSSAAGGMGTGGDPELGRKAVEEDMQMVSGLFDGADVVFVVAALGGGTGTGGVCPVVNAAAEAGAMTFCFATLPFEFEGPVRTSKARPAVEDLRLCSDAVVVMPNDRLFRSTGEETIAGSFEKADRILGEGAAGIWRMVTRPGYINLDFADLKRVVTTRMSVCSLGFATAEGEDRAARVVEKLTGSPLLDDGRLLSESRSCLVSIAGGPDLTLKEVDQVMKLISGKAADGADISMGTVIDESFEGSISVTVIASGEGGADLAADERASRAEDSGDAASSEKSSKTRVAGKAAQQAKLQLNAAGKGRFKGIEPTIFDGEDLDIPTFIRHGVSIQR